MAPATSLSNLPLQVLLYLNGWYDIVYVVLMLVLFIWKAHELPWPGAEMERLFALEVCLVILLGIVEYCRIFLASRGNKTESYVPLILSIVLSVLSITGFYYFVMRQVYVTRLDVILGSIGLGFIGLELLLSLLVVVSLIRAPPRVA